MYSSEFINLHPTQVRKAQKSSSIKSKSVDESVDYEGGDIREPIEALCFDVSLTNHGEDVVVLCGGDHGALWCFWPNGKVNNRALLENSE